MGAPACRQSVAMRESAQVLHSHPKGSSSKAGRHFTGVSLGREHAGVHRASSGPSGVVLNSPSPLAGLEAKLPGGKGGYCGIGLA